MTIIIITIATCLNAWLLWCTEQLHEVQTCLLHAWFRTVNSLFTSHGRAEIDNFMTGHMFGSLTSMLDAGSIKSRRDAAPAPATVGISIKADGVICAAFHLLRQIWHDVQFFRIRDTFLCSFCHIIVDLTLCGFHGNQMQSLPQLPMSRPKDGSNKCAAFQSVLQCRALPEKSI